MANSTRRIRRRSAQFAPRSKGRFVVAALTGAVLVAFAYQFAFATGQVGFIPDYGPTTDTGDTSGQGPGGVSTGRSGGSSGSGGSSAPIYSGVGALAVGAVAECTQTAPTLASTETRIVEVKLVADQTSLDAGTASCFHLRGRSAADNQWYDLTQRPETKIELEGAETGLVRQQGSTHRFLLPITAAPSLEGRTVKVVAQYQPAGGAALTSSTEVTLHVNR